MKKLSVFVTMLSLSWLATGCLSSPLLHHADADQIDLQKEKGRVQAPCQLSFADQELCASIEWRTMPTEDDAGAFTLRFWNSRLGGEHGPYATPEQSVAVKLWMPDMGHGSSPVKVAQAVDASGAAIPGVFNATDVFFVMGGHWEIWIQLKKEKQVVSQAKIDFDL